LKAVCSVKIRRRQSPAAIAAAREPPIAQFDAQNGFRESVINEFQQAVG
jgi:hypothetical protein